jgi:hypothetical protein
MAVIEWSLDQGRQKYLDVRVIRSIASGLVPHDGTALVTRPDPLVGLLGSPLKPVKKGYQVWRQYSRLFRLLLLAAEVDGTRGRGRLKVTDMCTWLAGTTHGGPPSDDEFLIQYFQRYYSPPPISYNFKPTVPRVFPVCALIRFMWSRIGIVAPPTVKQVTVGLNDIFTLVVGNKCVGNESKGYYRALRPTAYKPKAGIRRRTRELLSLVGQLSFVEWEPTSNYLTCDFSGFSATGADAVFAPLNNPPEHDCNSEVLSLGKLGGTSPKPMHVSPTASTPMDPIDVTFTEGKRVSAQHLRIERDPLLRKKFFAHFASTGSPMQCDVCGLRATSQYPWMTNDGQLLEVHHLLPLASPAATGAGGLSNLVPLCPTCHRAVHALYRIELKNLGIDDFPDKATAERTYSKAKAQKLP